jgi:hypothetical protein
MLLLIDKYQINNYLEIMYTPYQNVQQDLFLQRARKRKNAFWYSVQLFVTGLTGRYLEQSFSSEHKEGNLASWFESSNEKLNSSSQQSECCPGHNVHESLCSWTASTSCINGSPAHSSASKKLKRRQWWRSKDCSTCDRWDTMEPCMEDT